MQTINKNMFSGFEDQQTIWELYGELLDFYSDQNFSAAQIAYETNTDKKLINKILHRLIQHKAVICKGTDPWGAKIYQLDDKFTN